ncbi:hypothetical protein F444_23037 [Phytophthora nicotianae P1976]|uniref:Uncharacterized protein n=1 Tax=Phytophthora nicotianae P1976 TaxID=1317066 RepID=A0A080YW25_PHYNI|nr:hypothetical protein F444_23037 [Phytophthora nicotianae P1976]
METIFSMATFLIAGNASEAFGQVIAVLMIVPIPGDCNFEQKYTVAMSMDEKVFTSVEKLQGKPQVKADVDPDDDR